MKSTTFFLLLFFSATSVLAQQEYNGIYYYQGIAGDTAISYGRISKEHLNDTITFNYRYRVGLYRIVFHPGIDTQNNFDITILNEEDQEIDIIKYDEYIEFMIPSRTYLSIIADTNDVLGNDVDTVGRLFWIYNKNIFKEAPSFTVTDLNGIVYNNEGLKGKVVVINFWGIQCAPCVRELPQLNRVVQQYSEKDDVVFLAVSPDNEDKIKKFLEKRSFNYQIASLTGYSFSDLEAAFSNYGAPSHFIIDKEGNLVFQFFGASPRIESMIINCLNRFL